MLFLFFLGAKCYFLKTRKVEVLEIYVKRSRQWVKVYHACILSVNDQILLWLYKKAHQKTPIDNWELHIYVLLSTNLCLFYYYSFAIFHSSVHQIFGGPFLGKIKCQTHIPNLILILWTNFPNPKTLNLIYSYIFLRAGTCKDWDVVCQLLFFFMLLRILSVKCCLTDWFYQNSYLLQLKDNEWSLAPNSCTINAACLSNNKDEIVLSNSQRSGKW